jgi:hypothetical protein
MPSDEGVPEDGRPWRRQISAAPGEITPKARQKKRSRAAAPEIELDVLDRSDQSRLDADPAVSLIVLNHSILKGIERKVASLADILARMQLRAALADDDVAGNDGLIAEFLDTEPLRMTRASVAGSGLALLMCHDESSP